MTSLRNAAVIGTAVVASLVPTMTSALLLMTLPLSRLVCLASIRSIPASGRIRMDFRRRRSEQLPSMDFSPRLVLDRIAQHAEPLDLDLDDVAGLHPERRVAPG